MMQLFRDCSRDALEKGEVAVLIAFCIQAVRDLAVSVVRERGRFMQEACEATSGGMAAIIGLDENSAREVCEKTGVELANLNCPGQIVISGATDKLQSACDVAKAKGARRAMPLPVAGAYHSKLMSSAQPKLEKSLAAIPIGIPKLPVISNVTAQPHAAPSDIHRRLVEQVTAPVRWEASMRYLLDQGFTRFIELGRKYGDFYEVKSGLAETERVLTSANFLIDAEAKVQGALRSW